MKKRKFTYIWVTPSVGHVVEDDGSTKEMAERRIAWDSRPSQESDRFFRLCRRRFKVHGYRKNAPLFTWNQKRPWELRVRPYGVTQDPKTVGEVLYRGLKESV